MNKKGKIAAGVGALALLGVLFLFLPLDRYLIDFVQWVQQAGVWGGVVFGLAYVVLVTLLVPGTLLTLAAGFLFGLTWGVVVVSIAGTLGAITSFMAGRFLVHDWVAEKVEDRPRFQALYRAIDKQAFKTVVLARLVPIFPFALVNYGFSVTRVTFWKYALGSWLGMIPATIVYVYLGTFAGNLARLFAGEVEESPFQDTLFVVGGAAAVLITVLLTRQAKKELDEITEQTSKEKTTEARHEPRGAREPGSTQPGPTRAGPTQPGPTQQGAE